MSLSHKQNLPSASDHVMFFMNIQVCLGKGDVLLQIFFDRRGTPSSTFYKLQAPVWTKWKHPEGIEATSRTLIRLQFPGVRTRLLEQQAERRL